MDFEELYEKKISEILDKSHSWNLPIVEKNTSLEDVLSVLTSRNHIWVVESKKSGKLCGVITESDILKFLVPLRLPRYVFGRRYSKSIYYGTIEKAEDMMQKNIVSVHLDEKVGDALNRMVNCGLRRLPVVENDKLVGEITIHYIIQLLLGKI